VGTPGMTTVRANRRLLGVGVDSRTQAARHPERHAVSQAVHPCTIRNARPQRKGHRAAATFTTGGSAAWSTWSSMGGTFMV